MQFLQDTHSTFRIFEQRRQRRHNISNSTHRRRSEGVINADRGGNVKRFGSVACVFGSYDDLNPFVEVADAVIDLTF